MSTIPLYAISSIERHVLHKKYVSLGFEHEEARSKIKQFIEQLKRIHDKMRSENKTKVNINKKFKKEFEKLCQNLETQRIERR